jgi:hypothetical protein
MMTILRTWVFDLGRQVSEKFSKGVDSFAFFGRLCYLRVDDDNGIELCFVRGDKLERNSRLEARGRKWARSLSFSSVAEVEEHEDLVRSLLNEAAILNEYLFKRKVRK